MLVSAVLGFEDITEYQMIYAITDKKPNISDTNKTLPNRWVSPLLPFFTTDHPQLHDNGLNQRSRMDWWRTSALRWISIERLSKIIQLRKTKKLSEIRRILTKEESDITGSQENQSDNIRYTEADNWFFWKDKQHRKKGWVTTTNNKL